jgi:aryl carrier-like protein
LPQIETSAPAGGDPAQAIRSLWQELLGTADIGSDQNLFDLGARSLLVLRFVTRLKDMGVTGITVADVYDRPTLAGITAAARGQKVQARKSATSRPQNVQAIAIVGMASRTPGAANVEAFWQNLLDGREGIRHFTADELDASIPESLRSRPNFVAARGVLEDADRFDAAAPAARVVLERARRRCHRPHAHRSPHRRLCRQRQQHLCPGAAAGTA